jgi:hypothetical protein
VSSQPANVHTHDAWAERIADFEERLQGRFTWSRGDTVGAWLLTPDGHKIAAVQLEYAAGICEALNTPEGRHAYARRVIE